MLGPNACYSWIEFAPVLGYKWKDSTGILYQRQNLQTQFSRKQNQNAHFQSLKTSVVGLSSWKLGLKIWAQDTQLEPHA